MSGVIPLTATKSQILNIILGGINIRLDLLQRRSGIFMNVWQNDNLIVSNAICLTNTFIVRAPHLGLPGDFAFFDMQGNDDPDYTGLGLRWLLYYSGV